jgi:hypothetical protein
MTIRKLRDSGEGERAQSSRTWTIYSKIKSGKQSRREKAGWDWEGRGGEIEGDNAKMGVCGRNRITRPRTRNVMAREWEPEREKKRREERKRICMCVGSRNPNDALLVRFLYNFLSLFFFPGSSKFLLGIQMVWFLPELRDEFAWCGGLRVECWNWEQRHMMMMDGFWYKWWWIF